MEFINQHDKFLDILQILLDLGCQMCSDSVYYLLTKQKIHQITFYQGTSIESIKDFKQYLIYSKKLDNHIFEEKTINRNKYKWTIDKNEIIFTNKLPKTKNKYKQLVLTKNGLQKIGSKNIIETLKHLRSLKNDEMPTSANILLNWVKYFIHNKSTIYGGFIPRFITSETMEQLNRDIDIMTEEYNNIELLFKNMEESGFFTKFESTYGTGFKTSYKSGETKITFDIHKISDKNECDAFYNNLCVNDKNVTTKMIPEKLNFIKTLILTFCDIFNQNYTLIKPFPEKIKNKNSLRLVMKPLLMKDENFTIKYDYLNLINYVTTLDNLMSTTNCDKNDHHKYVIKQDNLCLECFNDQQE